MGTEMRYISWIFQTRRHKNRRGRSQRRLWHQVFGFTSSDPFCPPVPLTTFLSILDFSVSTIERRRLAWLKSGGSASICRSGLREELIEV